ncbi:presequence protease 2, putative [Entamoeba invadens IP1]|uniref:Presequence protease 2, putative n=1 Tax=Entamoeba invadens IP1 TaxID=370355 RepID=A0A0A1U1J9_ENTIV|nr:presequence protease 2, putative [Entamoeba invadens IP1]ELP84784.1 presequence protease 2, putative [Entamoeba invadens IP1]|eukprot:XP_004184130.1 presequence protease 2, putative [Entamoeba invadens IP1]
MDKFKLVHQEHLPSFNLQAKKYKHIKTQATVIKLISSDTNMTFSISFKTPPTDDSGTPHIIEHSVFCGSQNYTTKEPFADLNRGSYQNYLNAWTAPDTTVFPASSTNFTDYKNLMKVYLDAVFLPKMKYEILPLAQEGFRWEKNDNGNYFGNGVVYNEVKDSDVDADEIILRNIRKMLYNGTYKFDYGGVTSHIEKIDYKDVQKYYLEHYTPTNSLTVLYSPDDLLETECEILDSYFSLYEISDVSHIKLDDTLNVLVSQSPHTTQQKPLCLEYPVETKEDEEDNDVFCVAWPLGEIDSELSFSLEVIQKMIEETDGVLEERLDAKNICDGVYIDFDTNYKSPLFAIFGSGCTRTKFNSFISVLFDQLTKFGEFGFGEEKELAAFKLVKFEEKECEDDDGDEPKGVLFSEMCSRLFSHDKSDLLEDFKVDEIAEKVRAKMDNKYYANIIKKFFLDNKNCVYVKCTASHNLMRKMTENEVQRHKEITQKFSEEKIANIENISNELKRRQSIEDTPQQKASIPVLKLSDISRKGCDFSMTKISKSDLYNSDIPTYYKSNSTNGILYFELRFDTPDFTKDQIVIMKLLSYSITSFGTKKHKVSQLNTLINSDFGDLAFSVTTVSNNRLGNSYEQTQKSHAQFTITAKLLYENIDHALQTLNEIMNETNFTLKMLEKKVEDYVSDTEDAWKADPSSVVSGRLQKYLGYYGELEDAIYGLSNYYKVRQFSKTFSKNGKLLLRKMKELYKTIFSDHRAKLYFSCDESVKDDVLNKFCVIQTFLDKSEVGPNIEISEEKQMNEFFVFPTNTNYVGMSFNFLKNGHPFDANLKALFEIIEKKFLWDKVRVEGGAYDGSLSYQANGNVCITSYKDPHISKTFDTFRKIPQFCETLKMSEEEIEQFIVGILAVYDAPTNPQIFFEYCVEKEVGNSVENFNELREQLFSVTLEKMKEKIHVITEGIQNAVCCVAGNKNQIEKAGEKFEHVVNIFKTK